jgi:YcxB-like protein
MSYSPNQAVQLRFSYTEQEYLAAMRLFFWNSMEPLIRLMVIYVLFSAGIMLLSSLLNVSLPLWLFVILIFLVGLALFHGCVIDLPRRYFRGDPKFRDEYNLTFTDAGIEFKTPKINASVAWSLYTRVIENDSFYLMIYGKDIGSVSVLPKRAFQDSKQETTFREMLRRHVDRTLKLGEGERQNEYVPTSLEPPDWR